MDHGTTTAYQYTVVIEGMAPRVFGTSAEAVRYILSCPRSYKTRVFDPEGFLILTRGVFSRD